MDASRATELAAAAGQSQTGEAESASASSADTQTVDAAAVASTENAGTPDTASNLVVSTAADYVNIRKDPSEDAEVVGKLYANSVGTVAAAVDANGWVKITSGSVTGYVKSDYVATGSAAQQMADAVGTQKAIVTTETLRVRAAASEDSDVISLIGQGQSYEILGEENGWYKVNTDDGEGYISADFTDAGCFEGTGGRGLRDAVPRQPLRLGRLLSDKRNGLLRLYDGGVRPLRRLPSAL